MPEKLTSLQKQTTREVKEGARQSKKHAREAVARLQAEKRAAKKKKMTVEQYRDWQRIQSYKPKAADKPEPPHATLITDPGLNLPWQVRRDIAVADALARGDTTARALKLRTIEKAAEKIIELIREFY